MIDTHCHIDDPQYAEDLSAFLDQQKADGVEAMYVPGVDASSVKDVLKVCDRYPDYLFPALGLHPENVKEDWQEQLQTLKTAVDARMTNKSFPLGEDLGEAVPYAVYNIGNNQPENLLDFVTILQEELVRAGVLPEDYDFDAHKELVPMQPGDVPVTYADTTALERDFGFKPSTSLRQGLRAFAEWYAKFYGSKR